MHILTVSQIDELLPSKGTTKYYNKVSALTPEVHDFYRHFEVPGMGHCAGGASGNPVGLFDQLRAWVENGTAPDQTPVKVTDLKGTETDRILCPYPQVAVLGRNCSVESDIDLECWSCSI